MLLYNIRHFNIYHIAFRNSSNRVLSCSSKSVCQAQRFFSSQTSSHGQPLRKSAIFRTTITLALIGLPALYLVPSKKRSSSSNVLNDASFDWKSRSVKQITLDEAEAWLKIGEVVEKGPEGSGIQEWYTTSRPSNAICEDNFVESRYQIQSTSEDSKPWFFWGVFDGHAGSQTSIVLKETLVPYVVRSLTRLSTATPESIVSAIQSAFVLLDHEIIITGIEAMKNAPTTASILASLALGYCGSVAILSMYDPNTRNLHVACTGDSRAVLGRLNNDSPGLVNGGSSNKYTPVPLSIDQTGFLPSEVKRIESEHPGEKDLVNPKSGRTLDKIAPSRAFGDGLWKWDVASVKEMQEKYFGASPLPKSKTPPYLTAKPEVTTIKVQNGDFMIVASDGFWDHISSSQAVKLVELWLQARKSGSIGKDRDWIVEGTRKLGWQDERKMRDEDFVVWDENVATHLVRNAFGGRDRDVFLGVTGPKYPLSREVRDDITIQVVFFD